MNNKKLRNCIVLLIVKVKKENRLRIWLVPLESLVSPHLCNDTIGGGRQLWFLLLNFFVFFVYYNEVIFYFNN